MNTDDQIALPPCVCTHAYRNTIVQRQRIFQADTRPVYQRGPRSRLYMTAYMALFTLGMAGTAHGLWNAAWVSWRASERGVASQY